jgi:hypothetical protein
LPIINLIGSNVSKEIQYTFWLFNDSDDTLMITNIESVYSAYFQITNKLYQAKKRHSSLDVHYKTTSMISQPIIILQ